MKKILILFIVILNFIYADAELWVCDYNGFDTFTVCVDTDEAVNGAQFGISVPGFSTDSIGLTDATSGWQQYGTDSVLGFWFGGGAGLDANPGVAVPFFTFTGTFDGSGAAGNAEVVSANGSLVMSTPDAQNIAITVAYDTTWDGTLLDGDNGQPANYELSNAYPNPFNPTTSIDYNVANPGNVSIIIYDMLGREVKELVNEFVMPSNEAYTVMWDGTNNSGSLVSSGTYFYRMMSSDFVDTHTFTLMK